MEPSLITSKNLQPILEELKQREPIFHHAKVGTNDEEFRQLIDADFWEVGASGRRYSADHVVETLVERYASPHADNWRAEGFHVLEIATDNFLLTYTLIQDEVRVSRRSTIWRRIGDDWKILYHQGTLVQDI